MIILLIIYISSLAQVVPNTIPFIREKNDFLNKWEELSQFILRPKYAVL